MSSVLTKMDRYQLNKLLEKWYFLQHFVEMAEHFRDFPPELYMVDLESSTMTIRDAETVADWLDENASGAYVADHQLSVYWFRDHATATMFYLTWGTSFV